MLAPFSYSQMVGAGLIGFLVFGDVPNMTSIGGAALVVASGLFVWYRETYALKKVS